MRGCPGEPPALRGALPPGPHRVKFAPAGSLGKDNSFLSCKDRDLGDSHPQAYPTSHPGSALLGDGEGWGSWTQGPAQKTRWVLRR